MFLWNALLYKTIWGHSVEVASTNNGMSTHLERHSILTRLSDHTYTTNPSI